jgi:pimeloyl-ACP methyl ester carboxylesterase
LEQIYKDGYITTLVNDGLRDIIKTDVRIFDEILAIDQKKLLSKVECPILIIHGNADQAEKDLSEFSFKALPLLPRGSDIKIIAAADHLFLDHATEVIAMSLEWYQKHV